MQTTKKTGKSWLRYLFGACCLAYLLWSLFYINHLSKQVETEKSRVMSVARNLELWKQITIKNDGHLDQNTLMQENQDIHIELVENAYVEEGHKFYMMYYSEPAKEQDFKRYFSELVLDDYFYIVTDSDGKIKEFFWDKP
ncbi:hypothetical protein VIBNISO65_440055 [Vibrio nigripulchritudo SO65]|uniref:hypothetical protein n=1 Tax=Vibrio nigripulchritudo TaxID=28173 RepID=UPI0003B1AEF3|nr:hypothetical protein [Vibrio nigripulchritudo]CCN35724.1 hypothetical protein VIBNIAM115_1920054 [Vibrio nigripulchritudo AM115]CCN43696.1 hypothetical protein VIBNIFTn2_60055 [Vibrio nigripulchritudo FTn2]CCN65983.1 hypothetical protein VIBNIPon4_480020 [Vibrio nigripulchritudo POn4]CCN77998.1 hypothetical protein VIBNISO65_440055 [Vibrio nigripulchritudo SO65]